MSSGQPYASSSRLSSPSMASVATTSTTTSSTPLRRPPPSQPTKDYAVAFGALQSQYGLGGPISQPFPTVPRPKDSEKERRKKTQAKSEETPKRPGGAKDYEKAFGSLSSRLGFGGGWPTPKSSKQEARADGETR